MFTGDDSLPSQVCVAGESPQDQVSRIYQAVAIYADDASLQSYECVRGMPIWQQWVEIYKALYLISGTPEGLINPACVSIANLDVLSDVFCALLGSGNVPIPILSIDITLEENQDSFTRPVAAGYTGNGDPSPWQREAAVDILRGENFVDGEECVILEVDPTPCALVAPGVPSVTPGVEKFSASWSAIPVVVSLQKYQYQIDSDGWVDNGTNLTLTDISASAGDHTLSVRAVSTSGVAGDVSTSPTFEVEGSPVGPVATDNFDSYANFADLGAQPNWEDVSADQIYVFNPSGVAGVAYSAISAAENRLIRNIAVVGNNHYAYVEIVGSMGATAQGIGPAVRLSDSSDSGYFLVYFALDGTLYLVKKVAGVDVILTSEAKGYSSGAKVRLQASGSGAAIRLSVEEDVGSGFVAIPSMTNIDPATYFDGGFAGMVGFGNTGGVVDANFWECGNF